MSEFDKAIRTITYAEEIGQDDKSLCADISKLVFIGKSIAEEYGPMIKGVYISPANIIQTALTKLGEVEILILVDYSVAGEIKEISIDEFCRYYLQEEYKELKISKISVTHRCPSKGNYLCLYTNMSECAISEMIFSDEELLMLNKLLDEQRFMIEISKDWNNTKFHTFLIHVQKSEEYITLINCIPMFEKWYGLPFAEASTKSRFTVVPVIGFSQLPYDIPYDYIYREDLDLQRIEELLKESSEN